MSDFNAMQQQMAANAASSNGSVNGVGALGSMITGINFTSKPAGGLLGIVPDAQFGVANQQQTMPGLISSIMDSPKKNTWVDKFMASLREHFDSGKNKEPILASSGGGGGLGASAPAASSAPDMGAMLAAANFQASPMVSGPTIAATPPSASNVHGHGAPVADHGHAIG